MCTIGLPYPVEQQGDDPSAIVTTTASYQFGSGNIQTRETGKLVVSSTLVCA